MIILWSSICSMYHVTIIREMQQLDFIEVVSFVENSFMYVIFFHMHLRAILDVDIVDNLI